VMRALALGAKAAMVGRAWIWAMAAGGESGLRALLDTFHAELKTTMQLTGCTSVDDVGPHVLEARP